jgi:hypothetical protein
VRDPGWGRAQIGWRTLVGLVAGLATGYFVAPALGLPALLGLLFGGCSGCCPACWPATPRSVSWPVTSRGICRPSAGTAARHLAGPAQGGAGADRRGVPAGLSVSLRTRRALLRHSVVAFYLNGLLVPISLQGYQRTLAVAAVAAIFLARALLCWYRPVRDLLRTQQAFQAACRRAVASAAGVLQGRDRARRQLRRDLARVNTVALVFDGRLGGDDVDSRFAEYLHRSVFDVEDALVSLAGVVVALSAEQAPEARASTAAQMKALAADRPADDAPLRRPPQHFARPWRTSESSNCSTRSLTNWAPTSAACVPLSATRTTPSRIRCSSGAWSPWKEGAGRLVPGRWPGERLRSRRAGGGWCRGRLG